MYAFQIGSTVLNGQMLLYIAFGIFGYMTLQYWTKRHDTEYAKSLLDTAFTSFILWLTVWKLSPLLLDFQTTTGNLSSLLFLDGGAMGQLLAGASVSVFAVSRANKHAWPAAFLGDAIAVYVAGGTVAYQAALLMIGIDPFLPTVLTLVWAAAYAVYVLSHRSTGLSALLLAGLALLAFTSEHRLTLLFSLSSLQLVCLALALWIAGMSPVRTSKAAGQLRRAAVPLLAALAIAYGVYDSASPDRKSIDADAAEISATPIGLQRGELAPDFALTDTEGRVVRLSDYRGRRVILNFWASWCPPCRAEMPHMQRFYEKYAGEDVALVSVNLTALESSSDAAERFAAKRALTFPIALDTNGDTEDLYRISSYPTTYVLNENGVTDDIIVGPMTLDFMETLLR